MLKIKLALLIIVINCFTQYANYSFWHNIEREVRYKPEGDGFVIENGDKRFNRSLYGSNSDFRLEAGDLPEFALFLPHMGGNMKFGLIKGEESKWLKDAEYIKAKYIPGKMVYEVKDPFIGDAVLFMEIIPFAEEEGALVRVAYNGNDSINLLWVFGGACGKRFHRNGDIGADPESVFYLTPEYCKGDTFKVFNNSFDLSYYDVRAKQQKFLHGYFPQETEAHIGDANHQQNPLALLKSPSNGAPVLTGFLTLDENSGMQYFTVYKSNVKQKIEYSNLDDIYQKAEQKRKKLAGRITVSTPDSMLNTLDGALLMAADGVWDGQSFMHGAVAWRMPLNGWRGASMTDPLGWSDRTQTHFRGYAKAQYLEPDSGPSVPDPDKGLARQQEKKGNSLFTKGYISRRPGKENKPHHYDMNLVFIDQIIRHIDWTGDTAFLREIWPVIERHMEWEQRCFDGNDDGLYDAYCCIWASDALQYSGAGVTHSSAYNYFSNMKVAELAKVLGKDPKPYQDEALKILSAMNYQLWLPEEGKFAEYKDLLGNQMTHPSAAAWSYYHTIDSKVPDVFQSYLMAKNMYTSLPKIPVKANGLEEGLYTVSTSNWMPYTWSINNVALAEVMHTTLAYWQAGEVEKAFPLWKSALIESMYLGSCPGNMQQLSFYDAFRGELYRDFSDPTAMVVRSLVEGLFGITPDALNHTLRIKPGFPAEWDSARINLPEIAFQYQEKGMKDVYKISQSMPRKLDLELLLNAKYSEVERVIINGNAVEWELMTKTVDNPVIICKAPYSENYIIEVVWAGEELLNLSDKQQVVIDNEWAYKNKQVELLNVKDPQQFLLAYFLKGHKLDLSFKDTEGAKTIFVEIQQGAMKWWEPVNIEFRPNLEIEPDGLNPKKFIITNNGNKKVSVDIFLNYNKVPFVNELEIEALDEKEILLPKNQLISGSNTIKVKTRKDVYTSSIINWEVNNDSAAYSKVVFYDQMNDKVDQIFNQEYLSPRSPYPTLQLPVNGIGNWCYNTIHPNIVDSGLRFLAGKEQTIQFPNGVPFATQGSFGSNNVLYTSLWDNYPNEASIQVNQNGSHLYLLMVGTTNPMQSRFVNGIVDVIYKDDTSESLKLENPSNWWPIEQDYFQDGYAFDIGAPIPYRLHLKTGLMTRDFNNYTTIKGFAERAIDGGAATLLDLPINPDKVIKELKVRTIANDVVIGLMGVTIMK